MTVKHLLNRQEKYYPKALDLHNHFVVLAFEYFWKTKILSTKDINFLYRCMGILITLALLIKTGYINFFFRAIP